MSVVYNYFLEGNNISGFQEFPKNKKPEFINNPTPTEEMLITRTFQDVYGNYIWRMENLKIIKNETSPTIDQEARLKLSKTDMLKIIKWLIVGIENPTNPGFLKLKTEFNKLINGIDL